MKEGTNSAVWHDAAPHVDLGAVALGHARSHCPRSCNYGSLQHMCGKWTQRKEFSGDKCHLQLAVVAWTLLSLSFEVYHKAGCVAQVEVFYAHSFSLLYTTSCTVLFGTCKWWLTCQTEHFRLCWNATRMHSLSSCDVAWPIWWMPFQDIASFLELLTPLTNTFISLSIFSVHPPKSFWAVTTNFESL